MSSSKTANLQLNQWAAGDAFLRTEFNEDNSKIDAGVRALDAKIDREVGAVGSANCMVKLLAVTTTADAAQVDLDVSAIDWKQYTEVQMFAHIVSKDNTQYFFTVNHFKGAQDYYHAYGVDGTAGAYLGFFRVHNASDTASKHVFPCISGKTSTYGIHIQGGRLTNTSGYAMNSAIAALSALRSINVFSGSVNCKILAGSQFYLYGVKK